MRVFGIEFAVSLSDKNFVLPDGAERPAFMSGRFSLLNHNARDARLDIYGATKYQRQTHDELSRNGKDCCLLVHMELVRRHERIAKSDRLTWAHRMKSQRRGTALRVPTLVGSAWNSKRCRLKSNEVKLVPQTIGISVSMR